MVDIGACGSIGVARETVIGTYIAPTKFFPIQNETIKYVTSQLKRRGIRKSADVLGSVASSFQVEGDIEMEAFEEIVPYFLMAARTNTVKTGTTDKTYTVTGANCAGLGTLGKTLSVTIVRSGTVQAYTGVQVSSFRFTETDGVMMFNCTVMGLNEATQSAPTETYPATQTVFGPGTWDIEIPTATDVADVETFTFTVEDNLQSNQRLRNALGPAHLTYGERSVALELTRDFNNRTDFDAFKAGTAHSVSVKASKSATNAIEILMPVGYKESYEMNLSGQGDLVTAAITYFGAYNSATPGAYEIKVKTQEDIT